MNYTETVPCRPSDLQSLQRTHFYAGQLVGPDDFIQDQIHLRGKHRRHNRLLHGWGVVCGAAVCPSPEGGCNVEVRPGYVLGPYGDEIVIDETVTVDLCREDVNGDVRGPCDEVDPWCSDVSPEVRSGVVYLAVRFDECRTRPVRVDACGCGCDEGTCEYSQLRDSYTLRVLTELPKSHIETRRPSLLDVLTCRPARAAATRGSLGRGLNQPQLGDRPAEVFEGSGSVDDTRMRTCVGRPCPPCAEEPWVVLADVTLSGGEIKDIDCFANRRYVASFADFYFKCGPSRVIQTRPESASYAVEARTEPAPENAEVAEAAAAVQVAGGQWALVTADVAVKPGETVAEFLEREGARTVTTPAGTTFALRELYSSARVQPDQPLSSPADALRALEGAVADVESWRVVASRIGDQLDGPARESWLSGSLGAPAAAMELSASAISGLGEKSALGRALAGRTIADVAGETPEALAREAIEGEKDADREQVEAQAKAVHAAATSIARLAGAWRGSASAP
jgi:hypothetical protein